MTNDNESFVQITSEEYNRLLDREILLDFLESAGVDNWHGYDYAWKMYRYYKEHGNMDGFIDTI